MFIDQVNITCVLKEQQENALLYDQTDRNSMVPVL